MQILLDVPNSYLDVMHCGKEDFQREAKLAMAVRSQAAHYKLSEILPRHWQAVALRSGIPFLWKDMCHMVEVAPAALEHSRRQLALAGAPKRKGPVSSWPAHFAPQFYPVFLGTRQVYLLQQILGGWL